MNNVRLVWDGAVREYVKPEGLRSKFRFIKGPIPLVWVTKAAQLPGKTFQVALVIWYIHGLAKVATFSFSLKTAEAFGVSRKACYRGLHNLETAGLISLERKPGRVAIVTLFKEPEIG